MKKVVNKRSEILIGNKRGLKHGHYNGKKPSPTLTSWKAMRDRCNRKNSAQFEQYGGRGITITASWNDFNQFLDDMGARPDGKTLDRIDNERGYCKENCRWATRKEQARNTRWNKEFTYNGEAMCISAWAERIGIPKPTLHTRLFRGMAFETAIKLNQHKNA